MKQIKYTICVLLLLTNLTGCEDFLQKNPPSSPSQAVFWKSKADFDYALTACYSVMYDSPSIISQSISTFDNLTNNSYALHNGAFKTIPQGDLTPTSGGTPEQTYAFCYSAIGRVHQVLYQLENYNGGDMSANDRKFITAQCKALRGYFYHWLYLLFREVPLVTELLTLETMYQPKATRANIREQIIKDFDEAIANLPDLPYSDSKVTGRFTSASVKVLKARIMIFDAYGDTGVADVARIREVIPMLESIQGYSLAGTMRENFVSAKQLNSPEIMFSVRYLLPNLTNTIDFAFGAWNTNMPTRDLVNAFECTDGLEWGVSPLTVSVDESLINTRDGSKSAEQKAERSKLFLNRDRRMAETLSHSNTLMYTEEGYPDIDQGSGNASQTGFKMMKIVQPRTADNAPQQGDISDPDVVIVRYAHVLLMIAEAENEANGPTQKVYDAINKVRKRSGQPPLPEGLTQEEMRKRVRKEWRVETCFEGLHYFHLKQWRQMDLLNTFTDPYYVIKLYFAPAFYFWPIPQNEIDKSGGILVQDPNYS